MVPFYYDHQGKTSTAGLESMTDPYLSLTFQKEPSLMPQSPFLVFDLQDCLYLLFLLVCFSGLPGNKSFQTNANLLFTARIDTDKRIIPDKVFE